MGTEWVCVKELSQDWTTAALDYPSVVTLFAVAHLRSSPFDFSIMSWVKAWNVPSSHRRYMSFSEKSLKNQMLLRTYCHMDCLSLLMLICLPSPVDTTSYISLNSFTSLHSLLSQPWSCLTWSTVTTSLCRLFPWTPSSAQSQTSF